MLNFETDIMNNDKRKIILNVLWLSTFAIWTSPVFLPLHIFHSFSDFPELQRGNREWQDAI